jgi:prepilin-type processing-associated H-X9-DG protein
MKTNFSRDANGGLTLIEVLVVVACVVIVVAMLLPMRSHPDRSPIPGCMSNVRQIDLGLIMYADDNDGKFAIQTSTNNGGTREFLDGNQTFPHYQKLSKYILSMPVLVCPADENRHVANGYEHLTDANLSYFLNADVSTNNPSRSIMIGDRYFQANGTAVHHGTFTVKTNMELAWTFAMHRSRGILGFADGHAEVSRADNLNAIFQRQGLTSARLSVP